MNRQTTLHLTGMTCANCAARIEKGLSSIEGVSEASVNFALETAHVNHSSSKIKTSELVSKVSELGYGAVEKKQGSGIEELRQNEINRAKVRVFLSALLSLPLLWTMASHFSILSFIWVPDLFLNAWVQLGLATPVQFYIGYPFYKGAYKALRGKSSDMNVLVVIGTSTAYFYSLFLILNQAPGKPHPELYFETSAVLITLIILGKLFEALAKGKSTSALKSLMNLVPKTAWVVREGKEVSLPLEEVRVGDVVIVKPGGNIPVDGKVIQGSSYVDESMLTGESVPITKNPGDSLTGATLNQNGSLTMEATRVGEQTKLAQIIRVVEEAQNSKAPVQRIADKISGVFVPVVLTASALTFVYWFFWGGSGQGEFAIALENAIAVLVIACPCALGLATPTSIMAGSGRAAELGVLFKGAEYLEKTHQVNMVVMDKTGTLTHGTPEVTDIYPFERDEKDFLQWVGSLESRSEHPLALAVLKRVKELNIPLREVSDFESIPGVGIRGVVEGRSILAGTEKILGQKSITLPESEKEKKKLLEQKGRTVFVVGVDGIYGGMLAVADTLKPTSRDFINELRLKNIDVMMLTGDNSLTAKAIARELGIDSVVAEMLPQEKLAEIVKLQKSGKVVAMVGDGINDAPALAAADVGISLGTGTDVAMNAGGVTLMKGDLRSIIVALEISRHTMKNIKQNLFWALGYNTLGIPIAAMGFLAPWLAGAAMALSSVSVVLNALRLQRIKL